MVSLLVVMVAVFVFHEYQTSLEAVHVVVLELVHVHQTASFDPVAE
jgi:hypothetical protein